MKPFAPLPRRRWLWELGSHAHYPVVGVGVPLDRVSVPARKLLVPHGEEQDYMLCRSLATASARRNPVAGALHKDLAQRFAIDVHAWLEVRMLGQVHMLQHCGACLGKPVAGTAGAALTLVLRQR